MCARVRICACVRACVYADVCSCVGVRARVLTARVLCAHVRTSVRMQGVN